MSPSTGFGMTASTRSTRLARLSVARTVNLPGTAKASVRPCTVALLALAAFTTPWGVAHSSSCRAASVIGAGMAASFTTFQARSPATTKTWRCSPRTGWTPPPRGGSSPCVRTQTSRSDAVVARLRGPDLARPAEDLPDVRAPPVAREHLELLGGRLEADDRVGAEVAEPHDVLLVHVHGVRARALAGQPPHLPRLRPRIVHAHVAGVPLADPDPALAVGPHAPRALILRRRLDDGRGAPSGPMITPCGAAPWPRGISSTLPLAGSRRPSLPSRCAVYQTTPSALTATSCGEPPPDGRA